MTQGFFPIVRTLVAAFLLLAVAGCGATQPSRLYTLAHLSDSESAMDGGADARVGVAPVVLPKYLDRPQIVTRTSEHRLEAAEFHRWAEPLAGSMGQILAENLSLLLASDYVYVLPRKRRLQHDFLIETEIIRFEPTKDGEAVLMARWQIFREGDPSPARGRKSIIRRDGAAIGDYEAMARSLSAALADLSRDIAEEIVNQSSQ